MSNLGVRRCVESLTLDSYWKNGPLYKLRAILLMLRYLLGVELGPSSFLNIVNLFRTQKEANLVFNIVSTPILPIRREERLMSVQYMQS